MLSGFGQAKIMGRQRMYMYHFIAKIAIPQEYHFILTISAGTQHRFVQEHKWHYYVDNK
jgi:hypothetical protein